MASSPRPSAALAAFLSGFFIAAFAVGVSSALGDAQEESSPQPQVVVEGSYGRGEIAVAHRTIGERVAALRVPARRLQGGLRVRLRSLVWRDGTRPPFARVAEVNGVLDMAAAERGDVLVQHLVLTRAHVLLEQSQPGGQWNYERVLADLLDHDDANGDASGVGNGDDGERNSVLLTDVRIIDSRVQIDQPSTDLAFDDVDGQLARIQISAPNAIHPEIDVTRLSTEYRDLRSQEQIRVVAEDARVVLPGDSVVFRAAGAQLDNSRLTALKGVWTPGAPGLGLNVTGRANHVVLADLAFLSDKLPTTGRGSFTFALRPINDEVLELRLSDAEVETEGSRLRGAASLRTGGKALELLSVDARLEPLSLALVERMTGRTLPYGGALTGTVRGTGGNLSFNLNAQLTAAGLSEPFATRLEGAARLAGGEFTLQRLQAQLQDVPAAALRPIASGLPFSGTINGTITLNGPPERSPLSLSMRLAMAGGNIEVNGMLDLTREQPAYDLTGRLIDIGLAQIFEPRMPPARLSARFTLRGRGFQPESANAQLTLAGRFTGWRVQSDDTVMVAARVSNGALTVDQGLLELGPLHVESEGTWRFTTPETGAVRYRVAVDDLTPIAPYVPAFPDSASGKLQAQGSIAGSLARMRIEGDVRGEGVHFAGWAANSLRFKHTLVLGDTVPEIRVVGDASDITSPAAGAFSTATLDLQLDAPRLKLELRADRTEGGLIEVVADGNVPNVGVRQVVLQRMRIDLGAGRWALVSPASIEWGKAADGVEVHNFELTAPDRGGRLLVDGRILPLARIDVRVEADELPLADVQRMLGRRPVLTGALFANGEVRGPGEAPSINVEFRIDGGVYKQVGFSRVEGKLAYRAQLLTANTRVQFDTAGTLDASASLPVRVVFAPALDFAWLDAGEVRGSLVAENLKLAAVTGFFPELRDVQGGLSANATLSGTVGQPNLTGTINLEGGAVTVVPLDRRYTEITADIGFDQRSAQIRTLRARSDGWLDTSGHIEFPEIDDPTANLTVALRGFRPAGVEDREDAAATGEIRITGPLLRPTLSGAITFADGDVPVPQFGRRPFDQALAMPLDIKEPGATEGGSWFDNMHIENLRLTAGSGLWVSSRNARAQLTGTLTIDKPGEDLIIVGTLEGRRGTYTLEAGPIVRRFEIVNAQVRFLGSSEINPVLDVTARRVILDATGRELEIQVRVGGTLDAPTLSLASANAAQIPQSELLGFLIFGQPTLGLSGNYLPGEALLQETFLSGFAELATLELEAALGAPFDFFQIRLGGGPYGGLGSPTLVVGRELSNDVFLTVESGIAALFGPNTDGGPANSWAVRLEWRIDPRTSLRVGYEPANQVRRYRGIGVALPVNRRQQAAVEFRKRWTW
ncbi:MAG: translocation/assembly module TamB domain-containing protein [Longimicrobiales bacterium]